MQWSIPLNLNSMTNVTVDNSTPDKINQCYSGDYNGVWYTFEGYDSIVVIKNANGFFNVNYVLLEGNCENYQCISNGTLYDQSVLKIHTETGRKYLYIFMAKMYYCKPKLFTSRIIIHAQMQHH